MIRLICLLFPLIALTALAAEPTSPASSKKESSEEALERFASLVIKGHELENAGKYSEAIKVYTEALTLQNESPVTQIRRGICHARLGDNEKAASDLHAATVLPPRTVSDFYALSWLRATAPLARFRDGSLAVSYAQRALKEGEAAERYDALAAGYAEMGNFRLAYETVQKGIKFFPNSDRIPEMTKRLHLYSEKKKYRENWDSVGKNP